LSVDSFRKFRRFSSIVGFVVKSLGWEMRIGQFWNLEFQWFSLDSAKKCNEIPQKSWKKKVSEKSWCTFCTLWPHFCSFLCFYVCAFVHVISESFFQIALQAKENKKVFLALQKSGFCTAAILPNQFVMGFARCFFSSFHVLRTCHVCASSFFLHLGKPSFS